MAGLEPAWLRPLPTDPKSTWRAWAFARRKTVLDASDAVTQQLGALLRQQGARRVLAYRAIPGEPDISMLATEFELFTTRTRYKPKRHLTLHAWDTATELSQFGYLQPPANTPQVALDTLDAVVLPGLAYDLSGVRLGYGGGFYDRLLPGFSGLTVGVVWSALLVPALPGEAHDCRAAWLATEVGVSESV